jgi:hypothetical protein
MIEFNKIIDGLSNEDYHKHSAISSSQCKDLLISPWLYHHNRSHPVTQSQAMLFGSMFHSLVLEPDSFDNVYFVADKPKRNTKAGKEAYSQMEKVKGARTWISTDDFLQAQDMRHNLMKNDLVKVLLSGGRSEQSAFWTDKDSGIDCRARADYINLDKKYILDLKTTSSLADEFNFSTTVKKYHYDLSAAFYVDGFKNVIGDDFDFFIIAIESKEPHNFAVYKLSDAILDFGRGKYRQALEVFAKVKESGNFTVPYHDGLLVELVA